MIIVEYYCHNYSASAEYQYYNSTQGAIQIVNDIVRTYLEAESSKLKAFVSRLAWRLGGVPGIFPYGRANDAGLRSMLKEIS